MQLELILRILVLIGFIRLCNALGRHSRPEDVKNILGYTLTLKGGNRLPKPEDRPARVNNISSAG
jgi:hypothetical protein